MLDFCFTDEPSEEQWESREELLPTEEPETDQTSDNGMKHYHACTMD